MRVCVHALVDLYSTFWRASLGFLFSHVELPLLRSANSHGGTVASAVTQPAEQE